MNIDDAIKYVNDNWRLVYPTALKPIQIAYIDRPTEIILRAIQRLLDRGGKITKGVAHEGKEPAVLYDDAAYYLTRMSNEVRGEAYYKFDRANLNTFAGRIYLALLRDTPPAVGGGYTQADMDAAEKRGWNAALDHTSALVKGARRG